MIDKDKDYVGKIVKVNFSYKEHQKEKTGIVLKQINTPSKFALTMILLDGKTQDFDSRSIQFNKISSVRLDREVREALVSLYKAMDEQATFLSNFWKTKNELENNVRKAQSNLTAKTGLMDLSDFGKEIVSLFSERFPISDVSRNRLYFSMNSASSIDFTVAHCREVSKYASPEQYPFLYREYDNSIQIAHDSPALARFCEQNAPKEIPELKGKVSSTVSAFIGDKNLLGVHRVYEFPLKYGMSRKTIDFLEETYLTPSKRKTSLDAMIDSAQRRQSNAASKPTSKKKTRNWSDAR